MELDALKKLVSCLELNIVEGVYTKFEKIGPGADGKVLYRLEVVYKEFQPADFGGKVGSDGRP